MTTFLQLLFMFLFGGFFVTGIVWVIFWGIGVFAPPALIKELFRGQQLDTAPSGAGSFCAPFESAARAWAYETLRAHYRQDVYPNPGMVVRSADEGPTSGDNSPIWL
jgi:hypothetical protein